MELPKNITQIGEADAKCKIYVEDYVVSFLKQLNPLARDKTMAAALYGRRETEEDRTYLFVYGAGKLDFIQKEIRHLSQAQKQEIERVRRQYFSDYEFLGYRILDGEMVGGFHICEQDICRYVAGYAQFYEKNEAMLSYMLESRQEEAAPESVDQEKYDRVRERQEHRRSAYAEQHRMVSRESTKKDKKKTGLTQYHGLQATAAVVFVLLCGLGFLMNQSLAEGGEFSFEKLKQNFQERVLPEETMVAGTDIQVEVLKAQDRLSDAVAMENQGRKTEEDFLQEETADISENEENQGEIITDTMVPQAEPEQEEGASPQETEVVLEKETEAATEVTEEIIQASEAVPSDETAPEAYTVCKGDTLTGISIRTYGNEGHVQQICAANNIMNPDDIKAGQKILLP